MATVDNNTGGLLQDASTIEKTLIAVGIISAIVGFLFLPIVFGPFAIMLGVLEVVVYDTKRGAVLVVTGIGSLIIGFALGVVAVAAM